MHQLDRIEGMLETLLGTVGHAADHADMYMNRIETRKLVVEMFAAMQTGRKIEAIKAYRMLTGDGLKDSKDAIERIMR